MLIIHSYPHPTPTPQTQGAVVFLQYTPNTTCNLPNAIAAAAAYGAVAVLLYPPSTLSSGYINITEAVVSNRNGGGGGVGMQQPLALPIGTIAHSTATLALRTLQQQPLQQQQQQSSPSPSLTPTPPPKNMVYLQFDSTPPISVSTTLPFDDVAGYSAFGPTTDGRFKPDIVTVGQAVTAALANASCAVDARSGTSTAAPTIAGGVVLLRQYFMDGWYAPARSEYGWVGGGGEGGTVRAESTVGSESSSGNMVGVLKKSIAAGQQQQQQYNTSNSDTAAPVSGPIQQRPPSGALLKAVLLNGAVDMLGLAGMSCYFTHTIPQSIPHSLNPTVPQTHTPTTESNMPLEPTPSFRQGWGRAQLDKAVPLPGPGGALPFTLWVGDWQSVAQDGKREYCVYMPDAQGGGGDDEDDGSVAGNVRGLIVDRSCS